MKIKDKFGNLNEVQTASTDKIEAIISRNEIIELIETNQLDKENLVLISISDPIKESYNDEALTDSQVQGFKDSIRVKFWDIEEDFADYKIISDEVAKELQDFILKNIENKFIIHCRAGQSRSAAVGLAIEYISRDKYIMPNFACFTSEIIKHNRYSPNITVFNKIIVGID